MEQSKTCSNKIYFGISVVNLSVSRVIFCRFYRKINVFIPGLLNPVYESLIWSGESFWIMVQILIYGSEYLIWAQDFDSLTFNKYETRSMLTCFCFWSEILGSRGGEYEDGCLMGFLAL